MPIPLLRKSLQLLLIVLAIVLAAPESLRGQEVPSTQAKSGISAAQPVEVAAVEPLPAAPSSVRASESSSSGAPSAAWMTPMAFVSSPTPASRPEVHRFWDRENRFLFLAVGGLATADFFVTHANLASGGKELNPVTRVMAGSTPALAANFALEAGSIVGISYLFHRSGHHELERVTSVVNIAASGAAVGYSASHH